MDGRFSSCDPPNCDPEDAGIAPETNAPGSPCPGSAGDLKPTHLSSASPKRSRRSVQKRVVTVPFVDGDGSRPKGGGEGAPPSDSWAWRKYGQKPIKGSPYPRGYYRCSSSKGCPARKQVERSRVDPTMLVVTYASEHNHPWPRHKSHHQISSPSASNSRPSPTLSFEEDPAAPVHFSPPDLADPDDMFSDLIGEESARMRPDDYHWFSDVGSPSSASPPAAADDFLLGPIVSSADVAMPFPEDCDALGAGEEEEEDSLFAGLGELPECSVVFRRGSFERQMLMRGEESRPCGLAASR